MIRFDQKDHFMCVSVQIITHKTSPQHFEPSHGSKISRLDWTGLEHHLSGSAKRTSRWLRNTMPSSAAAVPLSGKLSGDGRLEIPESGDTVTLKLEKHHHSDLKITKKHHGDSKNTRTVSWRP